MPRWHGDIVDPASAYLVPARHTLLVAVDERDASIVATAALDSRGPLHPPNPRHLAERYPSGATAQLRRVYVRPGHRRRGLARRLVVELLAFAAADDGYRAAYLHTIRRWPAPRVSGGRWARSCTTSVRTRVAARVSCTSEVPLAR